MAGLKSSRNTITISESEGKNGTRPDASVTIKADGNLSAVGSTVRYNPNSTTGGKDVNGSNQRPAFVGLAHELGHADALDKGIQSPDYGPQPPVPGTTPPAEIHSLKIENVIRSEHTIPERPSYNE